eukprot:scaffold37705_cov74-Phaeocystis_antarctica.AAC.3
MIFGCAAVARLRASSSALKLSSLHICGATARRRKAVGWCLTRCDRACCDTGGTAAHSHPVTVDSRMQKRVSVHACTIWLGRCVRAGVGDSRSIATGFFARGVYRTNRIKPVCKTRLDLQTNETGSERAQTYNS